MLYRLTRSGQVEHCHQVAGHWGGEPRWHRVNIFHRNEASAHADQGARAIEWAHSTVLPRNATWEGVAALANTALDFAEATARGIRRYAGTPVRREVTAAVERALDACRTYSDRRFGVEIECFFPNWDAFRLFLSKVTDNGVIICDERYNHQTQSYWKVVEDGSLRDRYPQVAREVVSPPLSGRAGMQQLQVVCQALKDVGATVGESTGLHVHHDAHDMNADIVRNIVRGYHGSQTARRSILRNSRFSNQYCREFDQYTLGQYIDRADTIEGMGYNRYMVINMQAFPRHGTIEFRQHHGTVSFNDISAWVRLTQAMVEAGVRGISVFGSTLEELFATLGMDARDRVFYTNMRTRREGARQRSASSSSASSERRFAYR